MKAALDSQVEFLSKISDQYQTQSFQSKKSFEQKSFLLTAAKWNREKCETAKNSSTSDLPVTFVQKSPTRWFRGCSAGIPCRRGGRRDAPATAPGTGKQPRCWSATCGSGPWADAYTVGKWSRISSAQCVCLKDEDSGVSVHFEKSCFQWFVERRETCVTLGYKNRRAQLKSNRNLTHGSVGQR